MQNAMREMRVLESLLGEGCVDDVVVGLRWRGVSAFGQRVGSDVPRVRSWRAVDGVVVDGDDGEGGSGEEVRRGRGRG